MRGTDVPEVWEGRFKSFWGWTSAWRLQAKPPGHANSHHTPQAAFPPPSSRKAPEGRAWRLDPESNQRAAVWVRQLVTSPPILILTQLPPKLKKVYFLVSPLPPSLLPLFLPR